ncbi:MAG: hypothetical protein M3R17_15315 [Bacteroidota bacterium]|nr:hypothetical protein [Bacteroidota bacterium]
MLKAKTALPAFLFAACLYSCTAADKKETPGTDTVAVQEKHAFVSDVNYACTINNDSTPYHGTLKASVCWNDGKGKNVLVIAERPQYFWRDENKAMGKLAPDDESEEVAELFAWHYIYEAKENKWKALWTLNDFIFGCCDVNMEYLPGTLQITDLDTNGVAESIFTYSTSAGTGPIDNPWDGKLMLHVNAEKYSLKGPIGHIASSDQENIPPQPLFSENFVSADPALKKHALEMWNKSTAVRDSIYQSKFGTQ